jgi:hypothetical protein
MLVPGSSIFKSSKAPTTLGKIPKLGEHNQEIYGKLLGYDDEKLTHLQLRIYKEENVI